jgi:hypothetical protein
VRRVHDDVALRQAEADGHGGQGSALYPSASTGTAVAGLDTESGNCLRAIKRGALPVGTARGAEMERLVAARDVLVGVVHYAATGTAAIGPGHDVEPPARGLEP